MVMTSTNKHKKASGLAILTGLLRCSEGAEVAVATASGNRSANKNAAPRVSMDKESPTRGEI